MELKQGYKQTDVGLIPVDWKVEKLEEISEKIMVGIASAATHAYRSKGVILFRNQNIKSNYLDDKDILHISPEYEGLFKGKRLKSGDLLTARTGYPGTTCIVPKIYEGTQSFTTLITRLKTSNLIGEFISFYMNSEKGKLFFEANQIGGGQKNVNVETLKTMPIPLPPILEQKAIAQVLNDIENLIQTIEQKLVKKRDIKQGAMQQLLAPKEDWEVKKLGNIANFYNGKAHEQFIDSNGEYTVINSKFISRNGTVFKNSTVNLSPLKKGDITMVMSDIPNGKALAKCFLVPVGNKYALNQRICAIRTDEDVDNTFLALILNRNKYYLSFDSGTGQTNLKKTDVLECPIPLPPTKQEQTDIATVLSDMSKEIEMLEQKLSKYKMLKQGLMQNLLTGKIRLV